MFSTTMNSIASIPTVTCFVSLLVNASAMGQGVATVEEGARAKGVVLLRATIPSVPCPRYTTLRVSDDHHQDEEEASTVTIYGTFVQSGIIENEGCFLIVPAFAGPTDYHEIGFAFSHPGVYQVSWQFGSTGVSPVDFSVDQTVHIEDPAVPDLAFLAGFADPDLTRAMFGDDFFERQTGVARQHVMDPEVRAMKVIARLLEATRAKAPGEVVRPRGSIKNAVKSADALLALAKEFPESSYAPYAAYYVGCCYLAAGGDVLEKTVKERGIQDSSLTGKKLQALAAEPEAASHYAKAEEALTLAANRADLYLKPRVVYMQAFLVGMRGEWDEMERLLDKALAEAPGEGTIQELVDRARRNLAKAKERQDREEAPGKKD